MITLELNVMWGDSFFNMSTSFIFIEKVIALFIWRVNCINILITKKNPLKIKGGIKFHQTKFGWKQVKKTHLYDGQSILNFPRDYVNVSSRSFIWCDLELVNDFIFFF